MRVVWKEMLSGSDRMRTYTTIIVEITAINQEMIATLIGGMDQTRPDTKRLIYNTQIGNTCIAALIIEYPNTRVFMGVKEGDWTGHHSCPVILHQQ